VAEVSGPEARQGGPAQVPLVGIGSRSIKDRIQLSKRSPNPRGGKDGEPRTLAPVLLEPLVEPIVVGGGRTLHHGGVVRQQRKIVVIRALPLRTFRFGVLDTNAERGCVGLRE
jgi:hypothetical protein